MAFAAVRERVPAWSGPAALVALATIGATQLAVVSGSWSGPHDETAYWEAGQRLLAGQALYEVGAAANKPFVYWYPPPLAQVLAPITAVVPVAVYMAAFTILILGCLWWLSGGRPLEFLALVAFTPVAVELISRNVDLIVAALVVLALRRSPIFWVPATALKVTPVLGVLYLVLRGRWRDASVAIAAGLVVLVVSVALDPYAWRDFLEVAVSRVGSTGADSLLPVPYAARLIIGTLVVVTASRLPGVRGECLLVIGLTIANPTLWLYGFSVLVAIVPLATGWQDKPVRPMTTTGPSG